MVKKIYKVIAKYDETLLSFPVKRVPKINNKLCESIHVYKHGVINR